jgi:hypothetical protein
VVLLELSGDEFTTLASCGHRPPTLPVPGLIYLFGTAPRLLSQTTSSKPPLPVTACCLRGQQCWHLGDALPTRSYTAG